MASKLCEAQTRIGERKSSSSLRISIPLTGVCSALVVALILVSTLDSCSARPLDELFPTFGRRDLASAISTLKSLDNQYKFSRPRYGKRMTIEPISPEESKRMAEYSGTDDALPKGLNSEDWVVVNRALPLSKFSENFVRDLLAQNERVKLNQYHQQRQQQSQQSVEN